MREQSQYTSSQFSSQKTVTTHRPPPKSTNLYACVTKYNKYTETPDLKAHEQVIKKFIQNANDKVLFIFGPSGCGKHMLLANFMSKYHIPCQYRAESIDYNGNQNQFGGFDTDLHNDWKLKSLRELISQSIQTPATKVAIYEDFPMPTQQSSARELQQLKQFKKNFFRAIGENYCKIIFILNSQIYNRYYILPKDCQFVSEVNMKPYSVTEMKNIIKDFVAKHEQFDWVLRSKDVMDEIMELSNGDARKFLLHLFRYTIDKQGSRMQYMDKVSKSQYKFRLKNQQKFPLFHMLGKYLYAKRYDKSLKKDRVFSRQELQKLDPPFYFNPVDLFNKSNVPLNTFSDLLFQNYPSKIASLKDSIQISKMFCDIDSMFPFFITSKRLDSITLESQNMYIFLLTWGIILKNKSSAEVQRKFGSFRKSEYRQIANQINSKRNLLRKYFPFSSLSGLIRFGFIVRNSKTAKKYLITEIIKKRTRINNFLNDEGVKAIGQDQEQQLVKEDTSRNANSFIKSYKQKQQRKEKQKMILREIEMQGQSDIDD